MGDETQMTFSERNQNFQTVAMKDWSKLSNLILHENKDVLRNSLKSINKGLYLELEHMAKYTLKSRRNSKFSSNKS